MSPPTGFKPCLARALILCCLLAGGHPSDAQTVSETPGRPPDAPAGRLVRSLVAAASAEERRALLSAAERGAVNDALRKSLAAGGRGEKDAKRYARAVVFYESALAVAEFLGDRRGQAAALYEIAETYAQQGEHERAAGFYEKSWALDASVMTLQKLSQVIFNAGVVNFERGDYAKAMEFYRRSLAVLEQNGGRKIHLVAPVDGIGAIHYLKGEYAEAMEWHRRGLKLAEESGNRAAPAGPLFSLAADYRMQGDYASALKYYEQSLKLRESFGEDEIRQHGGAFLNARGTSTVLRHIGTTYFLQGNYPLALRYFERVLTRDEEARDEQGIAYSLGYLGGVHRAEGRYEQALECLERSLDKFEKLGQRDGAARMLATMASVFHLRGDSARALEYFGRSLALREQMDAKEGIASALAGVAAVRFSRGEHAQALEAAARSAEIVRRIGSPHALWGALLFAGRAHLALGHADEARRAFDESIATVESLRVQVAGGEEGQELFFADKVAPYQEVIGMLARADKAEEALSYAEAAKARVLLDALRAGRGRAAERRLTEAEAARERRLKQEMSALSIELRREQSSPSPRPAQVESLQSRLEKARLEYSAFQSVVYATHPELRVERGEARPATREDVAGLLTDEHTALVEYVVTESRTHLFVFTRGARSAELRAYSVDIARTELARRVEQFRQQLAQGNLLFSRAARDLYDLLLKPAAPELRDKRRLVIVPDDKLWELPFQALQTREGVYLIEQCAVSYAPSITVLREMTRKREARTRAPEAPLTLFALGNPLDGAATVGPSRPVLMRGGVEGLARLPEAERQVEALARVYGPRRSRVYTGAAAREERVKREAGGFRVLHLATHGTLNDASPMYSNVVLARGVEAGGKAGRDAGAEDGLLEAWELMEMRLDAELVVLSACETARGRITPGEGLIGLTWALFVAGSPTTVVSQWKVESASTTELMVGFHRHLQGRFSNARAGAEARVTKAEALRRAALELLRSERYSHPFYWAGFVMVGDGV